MLNKRATLLQRHTKEKFPEKTGSPAPKRQARRTRSSRWMGDGKRSSTKMLATLPSETEGYGE